MHDKHVADCVNTSTDLQSGVGPREPTQPSTHQYKATGREAAMSALLPGACCGGQATYRAAPGVVV